MEVFSRSKQSNMENVHQKLPQSYGTRTPLDQLAANNGNGEGPRFDAYNL